MIPAKKDIDVQNTLEGRKVEMSIDPTAFQHMMSIVTDLYSDREYALVREYSLNALDEHIQAGVSLPIEVRTPTQLFPFLRIRDYGNGLDSDGIVNVYSRYGASTKRSSNDVTGYLGVGCKSALSYTNQFTVVGIKGGIKTTVSVSRDENGLGTMTIVDESATDESSGVEILIPAKAENGFKRRAAFLFRFWPEGTVLLDGREPDHFLKEDMIEVSDDIVIVKGQRSDLTLDSLKHQLVMGNVPYPISSAECDFQLPQSFAVIAKVPNGSIEFAPSREALQYSPTTKKVLEEIREGVKAGLAEAINKEIEAATSCHGALHVVLAWRSVLGRAADGMTFKYRRHELPESILTPTEGERFLVSLGKVETDYYGKRIRVAKHSRFAAIDLRMVPDAIWVYGFEQTFTPSVKKKLWRWCDLHRDGDYPDNFIVCQTKPTSPWIDPANVIPWGPVHELKLPRTTPNGRTVIGGRIPGSYDVFEASGGTSIHMEDVPGDDIDTDLPVYYCVGNHNDARNATSRLAQIEDDFSLVYMTSNREAKFCRLFPQARKYHTAMREYATEWLQTLSSRDLCILRIGHFLKSTGNYTQRDLEALPHFGLDDPALTEARRLVEIMNLHVRYVRHLEDSYTFFSRFLVDKIPFWCHPLDAYPLFLSTHWRRMDSIERQHVLLYLNAAYRAGLTGGPNGQAPAS